MGGRRSMTDRAITVAGVLVAVVAFAPLASHWLTNPPDQRLVDLDVYRRGGLALLHGTPLYDVVTPPPQLLPFTYPPFAAVLAVPLALIGWTAVQWVWTGLLLLALAVTARHAFAGLLGRCGRWAPLVLGVVIALCAYPMPLRDQVRFGQVDILLVAMCLVDCVTLSSRRPRGLLVGLATAVKLTPGVFIIYFWVTGRRREAVTAAATSAAVTVGAFLLLPADSVEYWFHALFDSDRLGANTATSNQSIRGMLLRLYWPDAVTTALWAVAAAVVVYVGFRAARRASFAGAEVTGVAITGLIAVLVSPVSWIHHLAWLVIAFGALVGVVADRTRVAVAGVAWLYYVVPMPWWGIDVLAYGLAPRFVGRILQDAYGLGAVALISLLAWWLPNRRSIYSESEGVSTSRTEVEVGTLKA